MTQQHPEETQALPEDVEQETIDPTTLLDDDGEIPDDFDDEDEDVL